MRIDCPHVGCGKAFIVERNDALFCPFCGLPLYVKGSGLQEQIRQLRLLHHRTMERVTELEGVVLQRGGIVPPDFRWFANTTYTPSSKWYYPHAPAGADLPYSTEPEEDCPVDDDMLARAAAAKDWPNVGV